MKTLNSTKQRLSRLLSALPAEYSSYRAALDARKDVEVEEALEILTEAEHNIHPEVGMFAKRPTSGHKTAPRPWSLIQKEGQDCHLCKGRDHYMKSCPYTMVAVQAASEKRKAETSSRRSSDKVESKISQLEKTIESLVKELKAVKSKQKSKKAYVAGAIESESSSNDDKHQSEEECQEEAATFCKENVSTTSADTWISDSGASSHMTDNLGFFSKPLRQTGRTPIKVGGGRLYSTQRGTIRIRDTSGS